jgi:hypothetical protein
VRAIGQLDEDHAHVARHGQEHLAKRLCLIFLARVELQLVELGQPIDQFSHSNAEALDQVCLGDAAVLHGVVQQRRHERGRVELPARAQRRHSDRMGDVGFAAIAQLAQVRRVGKAVGLAHLLNACGVEIVEAVHERGKARRSGIGRGIRGRNRPPRRRGVCRKRMECHVHAVKCSAQRGAGAACK